VKNGLPAGVGVAMVVAAAVVDIEIGVKPGTGFGYTAD
jgi:hypothetical protein